MWTFFLPTVKFQITWLYQWLIAMIFVVKVHTFFTTITSVRHFKVIDATCDQLSNVFQYLWTKAISGIGLDGWTSTGLNIPLLWAPLSGAKNDNSNNDYNNKYQPSHHRAYKAIYGHSAIRRCAYIFELGKTNSTRKCVLELFILWFFSPSAGGIQRLIECAVVLQPRSNCRKMLLIYNSWTFRTL